MILKPWRDVAMRDAALLFLLALAVRLIQLDHTPYVDELNHVLAARSLLTGGTLRIDGGAEYGRAWMFTYLVAAFFKLFGVSLVVARIPAVLGGALLCVAVFVWTRSVAGRAAAWMAALLLCFYPESIWLSQQSRFYSVHALLYWLAATSAFWLLRRERLERRQAAWYAIVILVSLGFALHLQVLTVSGIAALLVWVATTEGPSAARRLARAPGRWWIGAALLVVVIIAAALVVGSGLGGRPVAMLSFADAWAAQERSNFRYYHWLMLQLYPTLWTLTPLLFLFALLRNARATVFCGVIFVTAFAVQSLAAWKAERYLFYAMPMLFVLWGMGLTEGVTVLRESLSRGFERMLPRPVQGRTVSRIVTVMLAVCVLFAMAGNLAFNYAVKMMVLGDAKWNAETRYRGEPDWGSARAELDSLLADDRVVVSSSDLKALYYLGRLDFVLFAGHLVTGDGQLAEFTPSWKTGVPLIGEPASLELIMNCHAKGLVLADPGQWRTRWGVPAEVADLVVARGQRVPLTARPPLLAYSWEGQVSDAGEECVAIAEASRSTQR